MDDKFDFEMPEIPDLGKMFDELSETLEELPGLIEESTKASESMDMPDLGALMSGLAGLANNLPGDLSSLENAMAGFGDQHAENMESAVGEPDWEFKFKIDVGEILSLAVEGEMDVSSLLAAHEATQTGEMGQEIDQVLDNLVDFEVDDALRADIFTQLKQGRGMARITSIRVLTCSIAGAPSKAAEQLTLSPEANIPLSVKNGSICFELAPMLTIKNKWDHAHIPTFVPFEGHVSIEIQKLSNQSKIVEELAFENNDHQIRLQLTCSLINNPN